MQLLLENYIQQLAEKKRRNTEGGLVAGNEPQTREDKPEQPDNFLKVINEVKPAKGANRNSKQSIQGAKAASKSQEYSFNLMSPLAT